MDICAADTLSHEQLLEAWNLAYSGYFVPIQFTPAQLADHLRCGEIDLARSLVATEGRALVGLSLLGVRGSRGWIGGFGIAPEFRGRGLSHRLFDEQMRRTRYGGPAQLQLEVFVQNWARKVYERAGFRVTRRLSIVQGTLPEGEPERGRHDATPRPWLAHHARLHAEWPAAWNREAVWLERSLREGDRALWVGEGGRPRGVLFYRLTDSGLRILDAAAEAAAAAELVLALAGTFPGGEVLLVNEPDGSPVQQALFMAGCSEPLAQHEMHWLGGAEEA
jgi:ribosomal protein S18 acetylase RimI-like enzyme